MKYILVIAVCFSMGFGSRHFFGGDGKAELAGPIIDEAAGVADSRVEDSESGDAKRDGVDSEGSVILQADGSSVKAWYEKDYSGDWSELFEELIGRSLRDDEPGKLIENLREMEVSKKIDLLENALAYDDRETVNELIGWMMWDLSATSPSDGLALFEEMSVSDRMTYDGSFLMGWANKDPEGAWHWLKTMDRDGVGTHFDARRIQRYELNILGRLSRDPDTVYQAFELAQSIDDLKSRRRNVREVVEEMAQQDISATVEMLQDTPDIDASIVDGVFNEWVKQDVSAAADFLQSNPDIGTEASVVAVANALLSGEMEMDKFMTLYENLPDAAQQEWMAQSAVSNLAKEDLDTAIDWVNRIENGSTKTRAGFMAIQNMGFHDNMDQHLRLIEEGYVGRRAGKLGLYSFALNEWKKVDPERVEEYVRGMPDDDFNMRQKVMKRLKIEE